jgi:hypothetical protein
VTRSQLGRGRRGFLSLVTLAALAGAPGTALAAAPAPDLMTRLAATAARVQPLIKRASYTVDGRMVTLDRDGNANSVKEMKARIESNGVDVKFLVIKYVEDGEDKTADAQKKAREKAQEPKSAKDKKRLPIPLLAEEQGRYLFDQVEVDGRDPSIVRIAFVPKVPQDDTIEGSAWVDTRTAMLVSVGFKVSKPPMFVDYMHFTVEFGTPTEIGPAVSRVIADGEGGLLFFRKRFHATATLSDYRFSP